MGFLSKMFGKKRDEDKAPAKNAPADRASGFNGDGKVPDALRFAAGKIDAQVAAKKITDARGDAFLGQLKAVEASSASEDAKLVSISQIIGGIIAG